MCFGCSKEPSHQDSSFEYPNRMFWWRNKKKYFSVTHSYLRACLRMYGKCSKILNTSHFLFSKKMWVIRAGIHKMFVIIANREDPDQTASPEAVCSGSALFV